MKKMLEKHGKVKCTGLGLGLIGIILFIIAAFVKNEDVIMAMDVFGFLFFLIGGFIAALSAKEHRLFKLLAFLFVTAFLATWVFPYGYFQGIDFYNYEMNRVGFGDFGAIINYAVYFTLDKILFLFVVAGFYGVLSKISGYQKLVSSIAKKLKKHEIITSVVMSFIIVGLTSMMKQSLAILIFIPFFMSILLNMKIDKLTTFAITFGSALIGILGAIYGTESLYFFNYYLKTDISEGLLYRVVICLIAFFLYNFFICMRLKKVVKEKELEEDITDVAFISEPTKAKTSTIPVIVFLIILAIIAILGFVNWADFNIEIFNDFHTWLKELKIGNDFTIFAYLLGVNAKAFGTFELLTITSVLMIFIIILAFLYRVKLQDFVESFYNGLKKMFKPVLCLIGIYMIFAVCYMSPFMPTITNWALNLTDGLNPYIASVVAFITSIFHADLGFTAYSVGSFVTTAYTGSVGYTIYTSMYGLVQVFMPTGLILLIGLSLMKIDYKTWFKYIWLFVVGMVIILLVLFTVLTYI